MLSQRGANIKTNRLFLTPNPDWRKSGIWYKNVPAGRNEISKWTKMSAQKTGLASGKFTNHSHRATAVTHLAKAGVDENQLTKITGHGNVGSIKPYLQLDKEFHAEMVNKMRNSNSGNNDVQVSSLSTSSTSNTTSDRCQTSVINFNSCVFNCENFNNSYFFFVVYLPVVVILD